MFIELFRNSKGWNTMLIVRRLIPIFRFVVSIAIKKLLYSIMSSFLSSGAFLTGGALHVFHITTSLIGRLISIIPASHYSSLLLSPIEGQHVRHARRIHRKLEKKLIEFKLTKVNELSHCWWLIIMKMAASITFAFYNFSFDNSNDHKVALKFTVKRCTESKKKVERNF